MSSAKSKQSVYEVYDHQKPEFLQHLLTKTEGLGSAIIYVRTTAEIHALSSEMTKAGMTVDSIHVKKKPSMAGKALTNYASGTIDYLILSEAISRNTSLENVQNVINYDFPDVPQDYIARVLECPEGQIISLVNPKISKQLLKLEGLLDAKLPRAIAEGFLYAKHALKVSTRNKSYKSSASTRSKPLQNKKKKLKKK